MTTEEPSGFALPAHIADGLRNAGKDLAGVDPFAAPKVSPAAFQRTRGKDRPRPHVFSTRRNAEQQAEFEQDHADSRQLRIQQAKELWYANIDPTFRDAYDDNTEITDRVERLKTRQGRHMTSLLLIGGNGIGKTWLAHSYANRCINEGVLNFGQIKIGDEDKIFGDAAYAGFGDRKAAIRNLIRPRVEMFVIDDVGVGAFPTPEVRQNLWFTLVNHCYREQLALVITTNMRVSDDIRDGKLVKKSPFREWIGDASYDRLRNMVGPKAIYRQKANERPGVIQKAEADYQRFKESQDHRHEDDED